MIDNAVIYTDTLTISSFIQISIREHDSTLCLGPDGWEQNGRHTFQLQVMS